MEFYSLLASFHEEEWYAIGWWTRRALAVSAIGGAVVAGTLLGVHAVTEHTDNEIIEGAAYGVGASLTVSEAAAITIGGAMIVDRWRRDHQTAGVVGYHDAGVVADRPLLNQMFNDVVQDLDPAYDKRPQQYHVKNDVE